MSTGLIIAVDGPAASGKGTLAKRLAAHFSLPVLDTGLLYRAVGQHLHDETGALDDEAVAIAIARRFSPDWLGDDRLRRREAGEAASRVAKIDGVRAALRRFQQDFAHQPGGAVLDGRDIGTVIAPDATAKLWIDADVAVRAGRRYRELHARGEPVTEADILADLVARDARDAPNMLIAPEAIRIDTTTMDADAAFRTALSQVLAVVEQAGHSRR